MGRDYRSGRSFDVLIKQELICFSNIYLKQLIKVYLGFDVDEWLLRILQ